MDRTQSASQRQANFRKQHMYTRSRINSLVRNSAKHNLWVLARHHGITETAMLEKLVFEAIQKL